MPRPVSTTWNATRRVSLDEIASEMMTVTLPVSVNYMRGIDYGQQELDWSGQNEAKRARTFNEFPKMLNKQRLSPPISTIALNLLGN